MNTPQSGMFQLQCRLNKIHVTVLQISARHDTIEFLNPAKKGIVSLQTYNNMDAAYNFESASMSPFQY